MSEYVRMPKADYVAACNSIRAKTGKSDVIKSGAMSAEIDSITGGGGGSADARVKYVTFMYGATELYKQPVIAGDTCKDPYANNLISAPTKESTAQYDYTFNGWSLTDGGSASSSALTNVTEDRTVYAAFKADVRYYTITWLDSDGVTELPGQTQWAYGTVPSYTPSKDGYNFGGWSPTPTAVTGDATYTVSSWTEKLSGACGDTAYWELVGGVLTISGTGEINVSASTSGQPWASHRSSITSLVIGEGITSVGVCAFSSCTRITSVSLPITLTYIGHEAFNYCMRVEEFVIPNSVTEIASSAFINCTGMTSLILGSGLTKIRQSAFKKASALTSVTIPSSVTEIEYQAFHGTGLTSATFENSSGWRYYTSTSATSGTAISSADLSNPTTAATRLKSTYVNYYWKRS